MICKDCGVKKGQYPRWLCRFCDRKAGTYVPLSRLESRFCRKCRNRIIQRYGLCAGCWGELRGDVKAPASTGLRVRRSFYMVVAAPELVAAPEPEPRKPLRSVLLEGQWFDVMWDGSR